MSQHVADLIAAIDRKDTDGIRAAYAPGARLIAMTPNTFQVHEGVDAVAAKLAEWYTTWEEAPAYSFVSTTEDGERSVVEFERTSTYEGASWVVRQAHVLTSGPGGIEDHRMYCCGPREGRPELGAVYGEAGR
jgi:ketosteroid isomerase-like protein